MYFSRLRLQASLADMAPPRYPHSCVACQSRLLFFQSDGSLDKDKGWYQAIDDNWHSQGWVHMFNLYYEQALTQAKRGCELMFYLVSLRQPDTWLGSQLRAYYNNPNREQIVLDWVNEAGDRVDGGDLKRTFTLCTTQE